MTLASTARFTPFALFMGLIPIHAQTTPGWQPLNAGVRTGNQQMALSIGHDFRREFEPDLKRVFTH
jgi:hypothetical protein